MEPTTKEVWPLAVQQPNSALEKVNVRRLIATIQKSIGEQPQLNNIRRSPGLLLIKQRSISMLYGDGLASALRAFVLGVFVFGIFVGAFIFLGLPFIWEKIKPIIHSTTGG